MLATELRKKKLKTLILNLQQQYSFAMRSFGRGFQILGQGSQIRPIVCLLLVIFILYYLNSHAQISNYMNKYKAMVGSFQPKANKKVRTHVDRFSNNVSPFLIYKDQCFAGKKPATIEDILVLVNYLKVSENKICRDQYEMFASIYHIRLKYTTIVITDEFMSKVKKWLNNDYNLIEAAKNQSVIFIDNLYTKESVVFNPVRANRPGTSTGDVRKYIKRLVEDTSKDCDFCNYKSFTAQDEFGRMESTHTVIVSNTFKIDRFHGMMLFRTHDPLNFSQHQYIDGMNLALKWFLRTFEVDPTHEYRFMYFDLLPKASASQVHPHMHLMLGDYSYYSRWNILHQAGHMYSKDHNQVNYWNDVLQIHSALGLTVRFGQASVMAYLTPFKDYEVIVISKKPCLDFFRLAFFTMRTLMDELQQYSLSMGYVFPKIRTNFKYGDELPMMVRIVSRGPADNPRGDVSSFDLFGTSNVNKDPFKVIKKVREYVDKKRSEKFTFDDWNDDEYPTRSG